MNCLESVGEQKVPEGCKDFLEIIVVDDCSPAEAGITAKAIVNQFKKKYKISVNLIQHESNKGLVEARRTAIYAAKGKYVFNLDSDDSLPSDALLKLYQKAESSGADIVHGKASVYFGDNYAKAIDSNPELMEKHRADREKQVNNVYDGELINSNLDSTDGKNQILDGFLLESNHMGFLWGKLFLRETYLNAFNHIPPIECTMCEDMIQYIWICYESKKYAGIGDVVYNYSINTGISSRSVIDNLARWKMVCSTAGVFTALYQDFDNPDVHFSDEIKDTVRKSCLYHLKNNLLQWKQAVVPELKDEAYKMLCEYWGESFVEKVKATIEELN